MAETRQSKLDTRLVESGSGGKWLIAAVIAVVLLLGALAWFSGGPTTSSPTLETTTPAAGADTMAPATPDEAPAGS